MLAELMAEPVEGGGVVMDVSDRGGVEIQVRVSV